MQKQNVAAIQWFVKAGIDDLAKYRVVELLMRSPGLSGSLDFFSDALGLKPQTLVAQLLEELAQRGVLTKQYPSTDSPPVYSVGADSWMRHRLARLYRLSSDTTVCAALLPQLARRSLRRAARLARRQQVASPGDAVSSLESLSAVSGSDPTAGD